MKTVSLYYEDCHKKEFTAQVLACTPGKGGYEVILDQTAFYPEGGGQPGDTGMLGDVRVLDTRHKEDEIVHICEAPLKVGSTVTGKLDWDRRFDFMQQHTAEHILSGLIHKQFGFHNVGFHMGADCVTMDFDGEIPKEALQALETQANQAVFANLPVLCDVPSEDKLQEISYRTKRPLPWPVRLVEVPGYDRCACCGIHVAYTGEIGLIKILSVVKVHQGIRMEMVCGNKALALLQKVYQQNMLVSQAFSAKLLETGAAAQKMNEQLAQQKFQITSLSRRLLGSIADGYQGKGNCVHFEADLPTATLRELADKIASSCGGTAVVFSGSDNLGYSFCIVDKEKDVSALGTRLMQLCHGRGGGKKGFFQGSLQCTRKELENVSIFV